MSERECWCGKTHPERTDDFHEAVTTFGHLVIAELRIPQLTRWLNDRLTRR